MIIILTFIVIVYDMAREGVKASGAYLHRDDCGGDGGIRGLFGSIFAGFCLVSPLGRIPRQLRVLKP
jgi:hypothetical protein